MWCILKINSCSTSGTRHATLVTNPVTSHKLGKVGLLVPLQRKRIKNQEFLERYVSIGNS